MNEFVWMLSGFLMGYALYRLFSGNKKQEDSYEARLQKVLHSKEHKVKGRYDE